MKKFTYHIFLFILIFTNISFLIISQTPNYPKAKRVNQTDTYHGRKVSDPYRWMENENSGELKNWINSQNSLLENFIKNNENRDNIKKKISDLSNYDSYTASTAFQTPLVAKRKNKYFFIKRFAGQFESVLFQRIGLNGKDEKLFELSETQKNNKLNLVGYEPGPNGKLIALFFSKNNSRWLSIGILDPQTGKLRSNLIDDFHGFGGNIAWKADSSGFYYVKFEKIEVKNSSPNPDNPSVLFHQIESSGKDRLILKKPDNQNSIYSISTTVDGNYLILNEITGNNRNLKIFYKDLNNRNSDFKALNDKGDSTYRFLGNKETTFWLYTNKNAPNGKIISIDIDQSDKISEKEIIPESKNAITAGSSVGGNAIGMFGDNIVLQYTVNNNPVIRIFDLQGKLKKEINLPKGGAVWGGFLGNQKDEEVFYRFISIVSPGNFYRLDLKTQKAEIFLQPELKIKPEDFVTKQIFYTSRDGTRVPMFITHKKGLKLNGHNPTFMYGYGAFGWVATTWYQPHILAFIEMGGVYALPGLRGGGEYGKNWHNSGSKINKQNSVDDYIAATEWLIKNQYTKPQLMIANGGSASSVTAAMAVMQRPELYGLAVIDIPILDMIRFGEFTNGRYWSSEFGSVKNKAEFDALYKISPYHNLQKGKCYPPMIVTVGENDRTALPLHGYKFTAQLQYVQGCRNPVLMKFMPATGHSFGNTIDQRIESMSDEMTFIMEILKKK